jgi:hypothetical protein
MDVELAKRVAHRALSLARSEAPVEGAADVLRAFARADRDVLALARSRCLAAVDQRPDDVAARRAILLLDATLAR